MVSDADFASMGAVKRRIGIAIDAAEDTIAEMTRSLRVLSAFRDTLFIRQDNIFSGIVLMFSEPCR